MFIPPNVGNDDDKNQFSDKPLPPVKPRNLSEDTASPDMLQGDELVAYVVGCMDQGSSNSEIRRQLIAFGYSPSEAKQIVEDVATSRTRNSRYASAPVIGNNNGVGSGNNNMLIGGIVCLIGIVVAVGSCMAAGEGGGRYVVAWGAIIWGAIQFFRGMSQSNQE
jgi:hypothetical protein